MSKLGLFCERSIEAGWLVILAAIPMYFDVYSTRVFEPDKTTYLRCLVLLMLLAQAVALSERSVVPPRPAMRRTPESPLLIVNRLRGTNPLFWPVVALALAEILATMTSILPSVSLFGSYQRLQGTYTFLTYVALFFLVAANLRTSAQLNRISLVVMFASLPISIYGLAQHLQLDPLPWGGDVVFRVTSTMGNAIFLAAYLIMVIPFTAARLAAVFRRVREPVAAPAAASGSPVGLVTWTAIVVGLVLVAATPLLLHTAVSGIWWLAPGFVGVFVLIATSPVVTVPSALRDRVEAAALGGLLALQILCVILTQSRGPWLGLFAGAIVFILLLETRGTRSRRLFLGTIGILGAVVLFLVVFNLPQSPLARFRDVPYVGRLGQLSQVDDGTGRVRVLIWQGTYQLLTTHPQIGFGPDPLAPIRWFVGYGPDAMHAAYNPVYPPALGDLESRNASPDRNHNDLLDHLVMSGLIGLIAYVLVVFFGLRLGWRLFRQSATFGEAALIAGLMAALVANLVETQTGIAIVSTKSYFWVILAMFVALTARREFFPAVADGRIPSLRPIAGGAPPATRPKRGATRQPSTGRVAAPPPVRRTPRAYVIVGYFAVVVVGQVIVAAISSTGVGGGQLLTLTSFLWIALALPFWALAELSTFDLRPARARTYAILAVGLVVSALAIVLNLNQIAADVYHKQGANLDQNQQFADSVRSYTEAIALAPLQDYYYLYLGRAYMELAKQAPAQGGAPGLQPTLASVLTVGASTSAQMSQMAALQSAEVVLERARDLDPLDPDHYANLGRLNRLWGEIADKSRLELAAQFSSQATTLSPHSAQLFDEWALTLVDQGKLADAQKQAETAANLDPQFATAHLVLGDVYLAENQIDAALTQHLWALKLDPISLSDSSFEKRISAYVDAGKAQQLAGAYQDAITTQPNRQDRLAYGYVLTRLGRLPDAILQFKYVGDQDPTDWVTQRSLAMLYLQASDRTAATAAAQQALRHAPTDQVQPLEAAFAQAGLNPGP
jgi:tetratricopeptide (TPR) repeat protein/O-antigen ligase